jgi:hypothetical protein
MIAPVLTGLYLDSDTSTCLLIGDIEIRLMLAFPFFLTWSLVSIVVSWLSFRSSLTVDSLDAAAVSISLSE